MTCWSEPCNEEITVDATLAPCMQEEWCRRGLALATIVAAIVLVAVSHGPILVALPITMAFGVAAGLLSAPLLSTPVVSAPIVSAIVPTTVMPVSVVMGKQRPRLLAGHTGQGWPRVAAVSYTHLTLPTNREV